MSETCHRIQRKFVVRIHGTFSKCNRKLQVRTHIDFNENEFFENMIEFEDEFAKNCLEYLEVFQVLSRMSFSKIQLTNSNSIEFEI